MPSRPRPNILWYCTDAQRHDTIGALGNPHIRTPNLDRLVRDGVGFLRAYTQSPMCTPARVSLMTGRYCASHHVYRNGNAGLPKTEVLVTRLLADAGYDCGLAGKLHMSSSKGGEQRPDDGFRVFHWSNLPNPDAADHLNEYHHWLRTEQGVDPHALFAGQHGLVCPGMPAHLHQSRWATEMAIRFIDAPRQGPWLMLVTPFAPHPPYNPPHDLMAHYDPATIPPPLFRESDLVRQERFKGIRHQNITAFNPLVDPIEEDGLAGVERDQEYYAALTYKPPPRVNCRRMKCGYYAEIELIDHHFGMLVDHLAAKGLLDDTLIIYHSDHGEMLGDHGLIFKGARFFEGAVHVPLICNWPAGLAGGQVRDELVELVDIAPTLLEAAGLEAPPFVQGKSLLPLVHAAPGTVHHKGHVVSDFYDSVGYSQVDDPTQATMSFDGRFKTIVYHRHDLGEIFDLQDDPGEFDNLWDVPGFRDRKLDLLIRHMDAVMATISPGPERVTQY